jgi:hypothetical protein
MDCVEVFEEIRLAVKTLRLLPPAFARQRMTAWPDIVQSFFDAYGYTPTSIRIVPTATQISRLDRVIEWIAPLPRDYAAVLWARAEGASFRKIGRRLGCSEGKCRYIFRLAVASIALANQPAKK